MPPPHDELLLLANVLLTTVSAPRSLRMPPPKGALLPEKVLLITLSTLESFRTPPPLLLVEPLRTVRFSSVALTLLPPVTFATRPLPLASRIVRLLDGLEVVHAFEDAENMNLLLGGQFHAEGA